MPTEEVVDQSFESIPAQKEKATKEGKILTFGKFEIALKTFCILIGSLFILLLFLTIFLPQILKSTQPPEPSPSPTPEPTPGEEETASPSAYATDSAILQIETAIGGLEEELKSTDLKETGLNPPVLDMEVEFERE